MQCIISRKRVRNEAKARVQRGCLKEYGAGCAFVKMERPATPPFEAVRAKPRPAARKSLGFSKALVVPIVVVQRLVCGG